jgi:hypothetical protein
MTGEGCIAAFLSLVMEGRVSYARGVAAPADFRSASMNYLLPVVFLLSFLRHFIVAVSGCGVFEE